MKHIVFLIFWRTFDWLIGEFDKPRAEAFMSDITIRPLEKDEYNAALNLVLHVFMRFQSDSFTPEGVDTFRRFVDPVHMLPLIECGIMFFRGAFDEGRLVGVIATRGFPHISLLFVNPSDHRRGIATLLVQDIVSIAKEKAFTAVSVNASSYAIPFYRRLGFVSLDTEKVENGIRFTPMTLNIG